MDENEKNEGSEPLEEKTPENPTETKSETENSPEADENIENAVLETEKSAAASEFAGEPKTAEDIVEKPVETAESSVEAAETVGNPENAAENSEKPSKFKGKAPKERNKDGSIAGRLQQRRAEEDKEILLVRSRWVKRSMSFTLVMLLIYFGFGPTLKTQFLITIAKTQIDDDDWFFWALDRLAENSEESAVPLFIQGLRSKDPNRRPRYIKLIETLSNESHSADIMGLIGSKEKMDRRYGLFAFYHLTNKDWLQKIELQKRVGAVLANDIDKKCRIYAALIFDRVKPLPAGIKDSLIKGSRDAAPSVRRISLNALSRYRDAEQTNLFIGLLKDKLGEVRHAAALGLAGIGNDRAIIALSDHYDSGEIWERKEVITALKDVDNPSATRVLIRAADDGNEQIAMLAVQYMGYRRTRVVNPSLVRALDSSSGLVRIAATRALASRKVKEAIPILIKNLDNYGGWEELEALDDSLQKLSGAKGIPAPGSQEESRRAAVKAWKTWYAKQKRS
jgi:hypothetical protein